MKSLDIPNITNNPTVNVALDTVNLKKQAIVFVSTRPSAEKTAEDISAKIHFGPNDAQSIKILAKLSLEILKSLDSPTKQCERLSKCVKKGIAFHHSGLTAKQRGLIENNFREGNLKIICATPTLAAGVDLPAYRAIIRDLKRFTQNGYDWIPVLEYHQMAGRAGRPKYDTKGECIIFASSDSEAGELTERFIKGEPEEIYSKLAVEPVLRTYLLSLISTRFVGSRKEIMQFMAGTFWAHQFKDLSRMETIINKMLALLTEWKFISSSDNSGFQSALDIQEESVRPTILGSRVSQLYLDPLTAHGFVNGIEQMHLKGISAFNLLQLACYSPEMRPLLRVKAKEFDDVQSKLIEEGQKILSKEPSLYESEYEDFLASIKTTLFMLDWMDETSEKDLLDKYNIRPGEVRSKLDRAEWLLYSMLELGKILQTRTMKDILKVRTRLQYGVKEELLPLIRLKNIGRIRSRRLFNNKIKSLQDIKNIDISTLTQIIGSAHIAIDIKKQLGQEVKGVPKLKRKGQLSMEKY